MKLAVFVFAAYIAVTLIGQAMQVRRNNVQLASLKGQISEQQKENAETQRTLSENDEQFMESVARKSLGYAKPNERIFVDASAN